MDSRPDKLSCVREKYSPDDPLTSIDCRLAIEKIICQARLIGFEIARKQMPFFNLASRKPMLEGDPRDFDGILAEIKNDMFKALKVNAIEAVYASVPPLADALKTLVKAHNDFVASSGIQLLILKLC